MRPSFCQSCLAFFLKFLNYLQAFVGVSLILYSVWMLNHWHRHGHGGNGFSFDFDKLPVPWLVCSLMGIGILVCLIAFTGHIAAEAISGCCLCFYAVLTTILILLEAALVGDLVFNKHWEEDLPHDATGELKRLRAFIEANIGICKWVAVTVLVIQALSLLLAVILRGMASSKTGDYDSDEEFFTVRKPLLNPQGGPTFASTSFDNTVISSDTWNSRIKQKDINTNGVVRHPINLIPHSAVDQAVDQESSSKLILVSISQIISFLGGHESSIVAASDGLDFGASINILIYVFGQSQLSDNAMDPKTSGDLHS